MAESSLLVHIHKTLNTKIVVEINLFMTILFCYLSLGLQLTHETDWQSSIQIYSHHRSFHLNLQSKSEFKKHWVLWALSKFFAYISHS